MSSRVSIQQIVSTSAPAGAALGDEWFNPTTGILSKRTLVNGIVDWATVITSSGGRVTNTATSISTTTGALTVAGGIGVGGNINFGGSLFQNGVLFTGGGGIASFNSVQTFNTQTGTSYTLVLTDAGALVNMTNAVGSVVTIPNESSVAFSIGQRLDIGQYGLGSVTISAAAGVTLRTSDLPLLNTQYSIGTLIKIGSNEWQFAGPATSTIGYTGSAGPAGYNGSRGVDGFVGSNGYFGSGGYLGSTGFTGSMGGFGSIQLLNTQTGTAYTLVLGDAGQLVNINNPVGTILTVPPESSVAFVIGQRIDIGQIGLGYVSIIAGSGVVLRTTDLPLLNTQYSIGTLIKIGSNEWTFAGPSISQAGPQGPPGPAGGYSGSVGYTGSASTASGYVGSTGYTGSIGPNGSPTNIVGTTSSNTLIPGWPTSYGGTYNDGYTTTNGDLYVWKSSGSSSISLEYLIVSGGGGGGSWNSGGGGAGGMATGTAELIASTTYVVTVGAGASAVASGTGNIGDNSAIVNSINLGYSGKFNGISQYVTFPQAAADGLSSGTSGNYTVEAWVYQTAAPTGTTYTTANPLMTWGPNSSALNAMYSITTTGYVFIGRGGSGYVNITATTPSINTWAHLAFVNVGTTMNVYLNGTVVGSGSITGTWATGNAVASIGRADSKYFPGYISSLRLVAGVAVYTGSFTTSIRPLANTQGTGTNIAAITGSQTALLTLQQSTFIDSSVNNHTITPAGSPTISPTVVPGGKFTFGGGGGGAYPSSSPTNGGSGGGGGTTNNGLFGLGISCQGNNGGAAQSSSTPPYAGAGGGGAGQVGQSANPGNGGNGLQSAITGTNVYYAGGGGGGGNSGFGIGGLGGGGAGSTSAGNAGLGGFGGGGGGGGSTNTGPGGAGGGGVVVIRYPSNWTSPTITGSPQLTSACGYTIYRWTISGSMAAPVQSGGTGSWLYVGNIRGYTGSVGSLPTSSINELNDVDTLTVPPTFNGQALVWNTSTSQWTPGTAVGGSEFSIFMLAGM